MSKQIIELEQGYPITIGDAVLDKDGTNFASKMDELKDKVQEGVTEVGEKMAELNETMQNLPDGQAVSAQVAVNTTKLSELEGEIGAVNGYHRAIDLDTATLGNGIIDNGVWVALGSSAYKHIAIPVKGGKVLIKTPVSVYGQIAFLSDYVTPVANQSAIFCQGESLRSLMNNVELTFDIPDDCRFVYVRMGNAKPQEVTISKEGVVDEIVRNLDELTEKAVLVTKEVISANKFDSIFDGVGYLDNGQPVANANYKYSTKYYPIDGTSEYYYLSTVAPTACCITWYDENKQFISRANLGDGTYRNAVKGSNAVYFRVDINASFDGLVYVGTTMNAEHLYEPYKEVAYFDKDARLKRRPIVTFVDDDCEPLALQRLEQIVDATGYPITCALITGNVGEDGYPSWDELRRLRGKGFVFVSHTNIEHAMEGLTADEVIDSLNTSQMLMEQHSMNDTQYLIYPQGKRDAVAKPIVESYFKYGFLTSSSNFDSNIITALDTRDKRYNIRRVSIDPMDWAQYRRYVDAIVERHGMVIFYGHAYHNEYDEAGLANYISLIDYARGKGCVIASLPDAIEEFIRES